MFLVELIASSFLDLLSKQARPECCCKLSVFLLNVHYRYLFFSFCTDLTEKSVFRSLNGYTSSLLIDNFTVTGGNEAEVNLVLFFIMLFLC